MAYLLVLKCVALIGFAISDSAIIKRSQDASSCVGENVTIAWEYGNPADILIASWTFNNGTLYTILRKVTTGAPTVQPSSPLNVEFIENGTIKLIDTLSSYTGTYALSLTYLTASPDSDSVNIIINDVPESLVFKENVTTHTFTCSGSSSIPTVIRVSTSDGNFRYEASPYTSSVATEGIECCYNGSAASCSTETFTATYDGTIYCQTVRDAPTTVPPTLFTTTQMIQNTTDPDPKCPWCLIIPWWWWCIILIVIGILIAICIVAAIVYCWYEGKCCFDEPRKCPCCPRNKSDGSDETENRPLSTTVATTNETSPETKSLQSTKHDGYQVNNQVVQTEGSFPSSIKTGHSKVGPDDNQRSGDPEKNTAGPISEVNNESINTPSAQPKLPKIGSKESRQAPNMDDVEAKKPKKKKKGIETKEDQTV